MNHDQETYELIERYLAGSMNAEEREAFEKLLEEDVELRAELDLHGSVQSLLADEELEQLDHQLSEIRNDYTKKQGAKIFPIRRLWYAAAAVLVLAISYIGFFRSDGTLSDHELFQAHFEPYPTDISARGDTIQSGQLISALRAYEEGRYNDAVREIKSLTTITDRSAFYLGLCHLELEDTQNALKEFGWVIDQNTSIYHDPALWYSALALLESGDRALAIEPLTKLVAEASGKYQKLASELLEKLQ